MIMLCTQCGYYDYTVILFSQVTTLVAFEGNSNNVLHKHQDQFCIAYQDDTVVYLNLLNDHREHVWLVLTKLHETGLYPMLSKYKFKT
jgi:hypothetical protein